MLLLPFEVASAANLECEPNQPRRGAAGSTGQAMPDDGLLHVMVAKDGSRWDFVKIFYSMCAGTFALHPLCKIYKVDFAELVTEGGAIDVSGEPLGSQPAHLTVKIHPQMLDVYY